MEMFFSQSNLSIFLNDYNSNLNHLEKCISYIPLFIFFSLIHRELHIYLPVFRKKDFDFFILFFSDEALNKITFLNNQIVRTTTENNIVISLNDDVERTYEKLNVPYFSIRTIHSFFKRNHEKEKLLYLSFHQQIYRNPYIFTTFIPNQISEDFYMYNPDEDIYRDMNEHSFYGYWRKVDGEMFELGRVIEGAEEIWIDSKRLDWLEMIMKLNTLSVKKKKIFYEEENEKEMIKRRFPNSVLWIFISKKSL